jgi:hypothetical protein
VAVSLFLSLSGLLSCGVLHRYVVATNMLCDRAKLANDVTFKRYVWQVLDQQSEGWRANCGGR